MITGHVAEEASKELEEVNDAYEDLSPAQSQVHAVRQHPTFLFNPKLNTNSLLQNQQQQAFNDRFNQQKQTVNIVQNQQEQIAPESTQFSGLDEAQLIGKLLTLSNLQNTGCSPLVRNWGSATDLINPIIGLNPTIVSNGGTQNIISLSPPSCCCTQPCSCCNNISDKSKAKKKYRRRKYKIVEPNIVDTTPETQIQAEDCGENRMLEGVGSSSFTLKQQDGRLLDDGLRGFYNVRQQLNSGEKLQQNDYYINGY